MAKHVIKKDQAATVEVTEGNSLWLVEKGVTLSGAPSLRNEGLDQVNFVVNGKLVTTGTGLASSWAVGEEYADNTSVAIGTSGHLDAGFIGILIEGADASVMNRGLVHAQETAIYFAGTGTRIENSGKIISESNAAIGSEFGGDFLIRNDGLLRGVDGGAAVVIWSAQGRLINGEDGVIDGAVYLTSSTEGSTLFNRGRITGDPDAVVLGTGDDRLVNRGEIDGNIALGAGNDVADLRKGKLSNSVVQGSDGHDTFIVDRTGIQIEEMTGGGQDTIGTKVSYALGDLSTDDIEILQALGKQDIDLAGNGLNNYLTGNLGDNTLFGGDGADLLIGGKGDDVLTGGTGTDAFFFFKNSGIDVVADFSLGVDDIQLSHFAGIDDFADVLSRMSSIDFDKDGDLDTVINFGDGNRIRLTDIGKEDLQMSDFHIFAA